MSHDQAMAQAYFNQHSATLNEIGARIGEVMKSGEVPFSTETMMKSVKNEKERQALEDYMKAKNDAPRIIENILNDLESGKCDPLISYKEPNQTPLAGYEAEIMREKWNCGMDMPGSVHRPLGLRHFSDWYMAIYLGNHDDFMKIIDSLSDENELEKQLNQRESVIQLSAIFLPIIGARVLWRENIEDKDLRALRIVFDKVERKHICILDKLLELGANVNTHDVAGFTPLHHCLTCTSNDYTFAIAVKLLQYGADPNAKNRFGSTPLASCIMANNIAGIKLLMDNGADPYIKDNSGISPYEMGVRIPDVNQQLRSRDKEFIKLERVEARKKNYKKCGRCFLDAEKRCTGCFLQWYCSVDCQRSDWKNHRERCKAVRSEYKEIEIEDLSFMNFHHKTRQVHSASNKPKTTNFIVKIQVNLMLADINTPMMCYNRERDVEFMVSTKTQFGKQLRQVIIDEDRKNLYKGYFYCITKEGKYYVNPTPQPWEKW